MTTSQWFSFYVAGLCLLLVAVAVIGTITWQRRSRDALLGIAFAVIAVVSTINLTLVGHRLRVYIDSNDAEIERQLQCDEKIINSLRIREELMRSESTSISDLPEIPTC